MWKFVTVWISIQWWTTVQKKNYLKFRPLFSKWTGINMFHSRGFSSITISFNVCEVSINYYFFLQHDILCFTILIHFFYLISFWKMKIMNTNHLWFQIFIGMSNITMFYFKLCQFFSSILSSLLTLQWVKQCRWWTN